MQEVKSKYWSSTHQYGIRISKSIQKAIEINWENGKTLWMDAVWQEMKKVRVVIEEYEGDPNQLVGYTEVTGQIVFDVK